MKSIRAFCLALTLIVTGSMMAELVTTSLRITKQDGSVVIIDLSEGQNDGETVLPVMTFTPTSMKIELPPKVDPSNPQASIQPATYTFEIEDLKSIGTEQGERSSIGQTFAPSNDISIAFTATDEITVKGGDNLSSSDVELYDLSGRSIPVGIEEQTPGRLRVSLARLAQGVYIVKIKSTTIKVNKK